MRRTGVRVAKWCEALYLRGHAMSAAPDQPLSKNASFSPKGNSHVGGYQVGSHTEGSKMDRRRQISAM